MCDKNIVCTYDYQGDDCPYDEKCMEDDCKCGCEFAKSWIDEDGNKIYKNGYNRRNQ